MAKKTSHGPPRMSNLEFHKQQIQSLLADTNTLHSIPSFPLDQGFYTRPDASGWWMVIKQIIIGKYIWQYLNIHSKDRDREVFFFDLLGSFGMNQVTMEGRTNIFTFPGTSVNAALISERSRKKFSCFFVNDYNEQTRSVLRQRFIALHNKYGLNYEIPSDPGNIDSNLWVQPVMRRLGHHHYHNYLMIIDNDGLSISFDTIRFIRAQSIYGDLIINYQTFAVNRRRNDTSLIRSFFGCEVNPELSMDELMELYIQQLHSIGFGRIERFRVQAESGFYYYLLFCCRSSVSGDWMNMIERYNSDQFLNMTDADIQGYWNMATGHGLYGFINKKSSQQT